MAEVATIEEIGTPLSLYLDLEDGQKADLITTARAAIAFAEMVQEIAYRVDPSIQIRVEFASGTEGSLSLNTLLKIAGEIKKDHPNLVAILIGVASFFVMHGIEHTYDKVLDHVFDKEKPVAVESLSPEAQKQVGEIVQRAMSDRTVQEKAQGVYKALEHDRAVRGVGVTARVGRKPFVLVPRAEFESRVQSMRSSIANQIVEKREWEREETVVLIKPVLLKEPRTWRFRGSSGEFSAIVRDIDFLESALDGDLGIPLREGLRMIILNKITEEQERGVWVVKKQEIIRVRRVYPPQEQGQLPLEER